MNNSCGTCKYSNDTKLNGGKPSPGTTWCSKRSMQMGKERQMTCYSGICQKTINRCTSCKHAKLHTPTGDLPRLGTVWCDRRHAEVNKQLCLECFE